MTAYYDTGAYTRKVSTTSSEAQTWFDRGLTWAYGFFNEESGALFSSRGRSRSRLSDGVLGHCLCGRALLQPAVGMARCD